MNVLPIEVRVQIMRQLPLMDWCRVSAVSKAWNQSMGIIWKTYYEKTLKGPVCGTIPDSNSHWRKWCLTYLWITKENLNVEPRFDENSDLDTSSVPKSIVTFLKENGYETLSRPQCFDSSIYTYSIKLRSLEILQLHKKAVEILFCFPVNTFDHWMDRLTVLKKIRRQVDINIRNHWLREASESVLFFWIRLKLKSRFPDIRDLKFKKAVKTSFGFPIAEVALLNFKHDFPYQVLPKIGAKIYLGMNFSELNNDRMLFYTDTDHSISVTGPRIVCWNHFIDTDGLAMLYELAIRHDKDEFIMSNDTKPYKKVVLENGEIIFKERERIVEKPKEKLFFGEGPLFPRWMDPPK